MLIVFKLELARLDTESEGAVRPSPRSGPRESELVTWVRNARIGHQVSDLETVDGETNPFHHRSPRAIPRRELARDQAENIQW